MDAHYEWALHGPYLDKSLIRNYMWYNFAANDGLCAERAFLRASIERRIPWPLPHDRDDNNGEDSRVNISEPLGSGSNATGFVLRLDRGSSNTLKKHRKLYLVYLQAEQGLRL